MTDIPKLKIMVSTINLQAYQVTLLDSIRGILRTQSSFFDEVLSQNKLPAKKSLTNFAENASS